MDEDNPTPEQTPAPPDTPADAMKTLRDQTKKARE